MSLKLDDSPFHHCRLCTKAYSSEKSLNKHLRKKHHAHGLVGRASPVLNLADSASTDDHRLLAKGDILTLAVPVVPSVGSRASLDDIIIVCPECGGTIKSKKGVAKHYMCFHNAVYSAWKSGWFGRSVRLMDLTREMIREFHASQEVSYGTGLVAKESKDPLEEEAATEEPDVADTGLVLDCSADEAEDSTNLSGRSGSELLRFPAKLQMPEPSHKVPPSVGLVAQRPAKRSKLKTQLATTAPFFMTKDGQLEFNSNENPLDINCPFCITHKTTIKGLAKHCVNHHPDEYAGWKNGKFGSVQLRYVRPDTGMVSQILGEFKQPTKQVAEAAGTKETEEISPQSVDGDDDVAENSGSATPTPPPPPRSSASPSAEAVGSRPLTGATIGATTSATTVAVAAAAAAAAANLSMFEDDKQATPCPFCGELIFSKGMGKHCIYFHHDQYQEWKAGKFGIVPLRFVPSQLGLSGDAQELSERALKRREARKKNGINITLPLTETAASAAAAATSPSDAATPDASSGNVTMRIKPSIFRGEVYRCGECDRVFEKSSSLSQHLRIHKYGPSMSKQGFQLHTTDEAGDDSAEDIDDEDDDGVVFICHCCEAAFDSANELKRHLIERHQDTDEPLPPSEEESEEIDRSVRFMCHLCHKRHSMRRSLIGHIRTHRAAASLSDDENTAATATREPGELSPEASPSSSPSSMSQMSQNRPDRHFCSVCQSCFPSARSLAQHNRVHKFGSNHSAMKSVNGSAAVIGDDDVEDDNVSEDLSRDGRLQISDATSFRDAASLTKALCPKCGKVFQDKFFLRDHLGRCFAEALADGELEMSDLASMAGVPMVGSKSTQDSAEEQQSAPVLGFKCPDCDKAFSTPANLAKHSVVHSSSSVSCKLCHREFRMPCHLARHFCDEKLQQHQQQQQQISALEVTATQAVNNTHHCELYNQVFQYAENLTVHRRFCQQHGRKSATAGPEESDDDASAGQMMLLLDCEDEEHECSMCNETFSDRASLDSHVANCSLNRFSQQQQQQQQASSSAARKGPAAPADMRSLQQPAQPQHPRTSGPPERERVLCPNCGKTYCRKDVLEAHLRTSCRGVKTATAAAAAAQSAGQPAAKVARLDLNHHLAFRCELCPSQFSSSLGLVVHRSKCHPQFYGPTHRRAVAAAAAAASAASTSASTVAPSAVGTFATAAASSQAPSADQGPLLSLPHRCSQCPRAFLTVGRLKEHLSSVHADAVGNGAAVNAEDADGDIDDVMGGLVQDDALEDKDDSPAGDAEQLNAEEEAHVGDVEFVDSVDSAEYPEADAYLCSECGGSYQTFDLLNRHLMEAHEIDSVTPEPPAIKFCDSALTQESHEPLLYQASSALPTGARKRKSAPMSMN